METSRKSKTFIFQIVVCFTLVFSITHAIAQQRADEPTTDTTQQQVREDFTDEELEKFVKANEKISHIQEESEKRMISAIEKEGLSIDRFNQILQSVQTPDRSQMNATPDELSSFNNAAQAIMNERQKTEQEMVASVEHEGIDLATYEQIMVAYQQNPTVQMKVDKLIGKKDD